MLVLSRNGEAKSIRLWAKRIPTLGLFTMALSTLLTFKYLEEECRGIPKIHGSKVLAKCQGPLCSPASAGFLAAAFSAGFSTGLTCKSGRIQTPI